MKKSFKYLTLASCLIVGPTLAHADSGSYQGKSPDQMFKAIDTNADSNVTLDEFKAWHSKKSKDGWSSSGGSREQSESSRGGSTRSGDRSRSDGSGSGSYGQTGGSHSGSSSSHTSESGSTGHPSGKVLNQDRLKVTNPDGSADPTGSAGQSSTPSGS